MSEYGYISMRNEDGTQWYGRHPEFNEDEGGYWTNCKENSLWSKDTFTALEATVSASRRHDSPDNGFFGIYQLTWHPVGTTSKA